MELLITGAFNASERQLNMIKSLGFNTFLLQDERGDIPEEFYSADAVICNGLFLYHNIEHFKNLKFIQLTSAGFDRVPMDYIKENNIEIHNARGVYSIPMAEFALSGVLSLYKHLGYFYENQKRHLWQKDRGLRELYGSTVCIVGCGSVGNECAKRFSAFGCDIIGVDIRPYKNDLYNEMLPLEKIDTALTAADIAVLALPLTDSTRHLMNYDRFAAMKRNSVLVNISRGAVVDTNALTDCLKEKLYGAVLDVFEEEPLSESSPLWDMKNVIISPHNSFIGNGNSVRLEQIVLNNLKRLS